MAGPQAVASCASELPPTSADCCQDIVPIRHPRLDQRQTLRHGPVERRPSTASSNPNPDACRCLMPAYRRITCTLSLYNLPVYIHPMYCISIYIHAQPTTARSYKSPTPSSSPHISFWPHQMALIVRVAFTLLLWAHVARSSTAGFVRAAPPPIVVFVGSIAASAHTHFDELSSEFEHNLQMPLALDWLLMG